MSDELVRRLREKGRFESNKTDREAADEIERLERELGEARAALMIAAVAMEEQGTLLPLQYQRLIIASLTNERES